MKAEEMFRIRDADWYLSAKGFCPLINQYLGTRCPERQIECPLLKKCRHSKKR